MRLAVCTTFDNASLRFLKEWVAFHYLVGFRKFYIFIVNSDNAAVSIIDKLRVHVDIRAFSISNSGGLSEGKIFSHVYANYGHTFDWIAVLRLNDYFFSPAAIHLSESLHFFAYKRLSAVAARRVKFVPLSSTPSDGRLVIDSYCSKYVSSFHSQNDVATIVRGHLGDKFSAHQDQFSFSTPSGTFDENLRVLNDSSEVADSRRPYRICVNTYPLPVPFQSDHSLTYSSSMYSDTVDDDSLSHLRPRLDELFRILL